MCVTFISYKTRFVYLYLYYEYTYKMHKKIHAYFTMMRVITDAIQSPVH